MLVMALPRRTQRADEECGGNKLTKDSCPGPEFAVAMNSRFNLSVDSCEIVEWSCSFKMTWMWGSRSRLAAALLIVAWGDRQHHHRLIDNDASK